MHLPSKSAPMNINPLPRLTAYLLVSVKDIVRLPGYLHRSEVGRCRCDMNVLPGKENPIGKGAQQLEQVCQSLQHRPLALFDSEYGCATLVEATATIDADKLMPIRSNRCLWSAPPPYTGKGRPKTHGEKFQLNAPKSWWKPEQTFLKIGTQKGSNQTLDNGITCIFEPLPNIR